MSDFKPDLRVTPLKGQPHFHYFKDEDIKPALDVVQELIFCYKHCDKEVTKTLQKIHKELHKHYSDRLEQDKIPVKLEPEKPIVQKKEVKSFKPVISTKSPKPFMKPRKITLVREV